MQGSTVKGFMVLQLGDIDRTAGQTYVAYSRCGSADRVCILNGCSYDILTTSINKAEGVKSRLLEDARLFCLMEKTKEIFVMLI